MMTLTPPNPNYPTITRILTDRLFPADDGQRPDEPISWVVSLRHPLLPDAQVLRMFVVDLGIEVYSVTNEGKFFRNLVPMRIVRLIEEVMVAEVCAAEIADAERRDDGDDDGDDDDDDEGLGGGDGSMPVSAPSVGAPLDGQPTS